MNSKVCLLYHQVKIFFMHIVSNSVLVVFFILFTFSILILSLIMASSIVLEKPFHTMRSFFLVISACSLFLSQILAIRCTWEEIQDVLQRHGNNRHSEFIVLYLLIFNKYSIHLDEF